MPTCRHNGVGIYYEVEGSGPPLVLLHGFGSSLHEWYDAGYVSTLADAYRLILVDAHGHGASDKPHEPDAYRTAHRVADVVAVLDDLGVDRAHVFGYSMGAVTAFAVAALASERCRSIVVGGAAPGDYTPPRPDPVCALLRQGVTAWADAMEQSLGPRATPAMRERWLRVDPEALIAVRTGAESHGFTAMMAWVTVPCLLFAGEAAREHDRAKLLATQLARATFASLPGVDHAEGFYRTDLTLPHVKRLLETASLDGDTRTGPYRG